MNEPDTDSDEWFDSQVATAFKKDGLMVTHYIIIVEVATDEGTTELIHHHSDNLSWHLRQGMLQGALEYDEGEEDDDD